ncbi:cysteine hydrolase, partial [Francisella tularensis subsp. holarctica]|nr:cysteine hydrolase [Francisella tularensis subsp. holarctica]
MKNTFLIVDDFINEIVDEKVAFVANNAQRIKDDENMK